MSEDSRDKDSTQELKALVGAEVSTVTLGHDVTLNFYGGIDREKNTHS